MTEAAEKVELKPETLLHMPCTSPGLTRPSNRHCAEISLSYVGRLCRTQCTNSEKGRDHRGALFPPLDPGLRPWSLSREIVPRPARDAAAGPYASPPVLLPPGSGHSRTRVNPRR